MTILLFWAWKVTGWLCEQWGAASTVLYTRWCKRVRVEPMATRVRDQLKQEIQDELMWKKYAPVNVQADAVMARIVRYMPTVFRKR